MFRILRVCFAVNGLAYEPSLDLSMSLSVDGKGRVKVDQFWGPSPRIVLLTPLMSSSHLLVSSSFLSFVVLFSSYQTAVSAFES